MSDYSELIARVRSPFALTERDAQEIADALEAQAKRIAELEAALKPFAGMAEYCKGMSDSESQCVFVGDLRAALAALKGEK